MPTLIPRDRTRQRTHLLCWGLALAAWAFTIWLAPTSPWFHTLTIASGYISLLYIFFTLLIGPLKLLTHKRNPVNLMLRRDVGIWAGITGLVHVAAGFQVHMGGDIVQYFFERDHHTLKPLVNLFGLSNDLGLLGAVVLVMLLLLSNDLSLRRLRGPTWKWLQRANYVLILLVLAHTIGYQMVVDRAPVLTKGVATLATVTLAVQLGGVLRQIGRRRQVAYKEPE